MNIEIPKYPKLVEKKILKYINHKNKQKYLAKEEIKQKEIAEIQIQSETWYKKLGDYTWEFIKENYGFILLISLICLLLLVRYIECNKRKERIKELVMKYAENN